MASAIHRITYLYFPSVNTPDFPVENYIINPDLSAVVGVEQQYWKVVGDSVVEMSEAEKAVVDAKLYRPSPVIIDGVPKEEDGKMVTVVSPAREGTMTWLTSRGDNMSPTPPDTGRGKGPKIKLDFTGSGTEYVDFQFSQPVELHDGAMWYTPVENWSHDDEFSLSVIIPANTPTVNGTNTGNCNLVEYIPSSGMHVIIPAAGDGTHDIDLSNAAPIFMPNSTGGFWEVDSSSGEITVSSTPGQSGWGLFDFPVESFFLRNIAMGHPLGIFEIDVYKAEWCHQSWIYRLSCTKNSSGAGTVTGWVMVFREDST
jgi:hypothetical protein